MKETVLILNDKINDLLLNEITEIEWKELMFLIRTRDMLRKWIKENETNSSKRV